MKRFVVLSDIHYPYQDRYCEKLLLEFLKDFHPDILVFNGDIFDMPQISKYAQRRREIMTTTPIQEHLDIGAAGMQELIAAAQPKEVKFALGNHEDRWEAYLGSEAKALASLRALDIDKLFQLQGIDWVPYGDGFWLNDSLFVYHGSYVGTNWTEKERKHIGASSITGHQHKQGVTYSRDRSRTYKNIGQGCLCTLNPPYLRTPSDWQQGFVYGYIFDSDKFRAIEVEIVQGVDSVWMAPEGTLYSVKRKLGTPCPETTKLKITKTSLTSNRGTPKAA